MLNSSKIFRYGIKRYQKLAFVCIFFALCLTLSSSTTSNAFFEPGATQMQKTQKAQILWDTYGVPHIFASSNISLFYAFGRAQMHNHADLLLSLYGQARGRAAEYWGPAYLTSDIFVRTMGFPQRAQKWYDMQSPAFRSYIDAFAAGINDYANEHPQEISTGKAVLPVKAVDVLAHGERIIAEFLLGNCSSVIDNGGTGKGSNGWAIAPIHATDGHAMLLANPHLPWQGDFTFFEAQLVSPSIHAYGAALVGFPVLSIAFNSFLSWTLTVNPLDSCDRYALTLSGNGYLFDGQVRPFETQQQELFVKQADGTKSRQSLTVKRSIQGPVFETSSGTQTQTIAVRITGVDQFPAYGMWQEWWDMARAQTLTDFQQALKRLQIPLFNVLYADHAGHILYLYNGQVPRKAFGDSSYWAAIVPGNTSTTLWNSLLTYDELPRIIDPADGWLQNANGPPWNATFPQMLNPQNYPPSLPAQSISLREQRSVRLLTEHAQLSFEQMVKDKFSAHMELADRILDDLIAAASSSNDATIQQEVAVLKSWDRTANAESRGALLFQQWKTEMDHMKVPIFANPWNPADPLNTPSGLADPQKAVAVLASAGLDLQKALGSFTVAWGDVYRLQRGNVDLPASGGPGDTLGIFRTLGFASQGGKWVADFGDSYIAAVEFSNPLKAHVLLTYGNASQPSSSHRGDQLALYSAQQLRVAWLSLPEIMQHLESRDSVQAP